ncbi:MAG: hypothetical protein PPP58_07440 [Natronomonas sp.]
MSRPVPEAAPIVGVVLTFGFGLFGLLFSSNHLSTLLISLCLLYGFTAFGIVRSPSPETVFRPDPVLAAGFLVAAVAALYGLVDGQPTFGVLVATVAVVPPALYHAHFGASINPLSPGTTLLCGLLAAIGLLVVGLLESRLVGAATATIVGVAAVEYHRVRGGHLRRSVRTAAVVVTLGGAIVVFGLAVAVGRPRDGLAFGAVLAAIGVFLQPFFRSGVPAAHRSRKKR